MLASIKRVIEARYVGPSPTFSELHVLRAILLLGEKSPLGRGALADQLRMGLGAARTLIERLRSGRIIKVEKGGCRLTAKGKAIHRQFTSVMTSPEPIDAGKLSVDTHSVALVVRRLGEKVRLGIEQRDAAVRAGATGATTIISKEGKYIIPNSSSDSERDFPNAVWRRISNVLAPRNGDVVILCSAKTGKEAEYGALAAALTLLE